MGGFVSLAIWAAVIFLILKGVNKGASQTGGREQTQHPSRQTMQPSQASQSSQQVWQGESSQPSRSSQQAWQGEASQAVPRRTVTDADRARLAEYRSKKAQGASVPIKQAQTKQDSGIDRRRSTQGSNIVERAKANSMRYAGQDATLAEIETAHGHSEHVGSAVAAYVDAEREAHRRMHEEPMPRVEEESCLGTVEDVMVKGFDGNLSFERDFIGEAQDFLMTISFPGQWE